MAKTKAPIYLSDKDMVHKELFGQLMESVDNLGEKLRPSVPISKGGQKYGFGIDKSQLNIAVDSVIAIAKAIRSQKGW